MALEVFTNQAQTTVSSGGTTAPSAGTVESWTVGSSSGFPSVDTGATLFHVADAAAASASEIIAVTAVSGTTWTVTRGAEGTAPVAHAAGFTIVQVVTAAGLVAMQNEAWQFRVEAYGAVGDGKVVGDVVVNGTTTITSATAAFTSADVGKTVMINGADGTTSAPLVTTIASVTNGTTAVLTSGASASTTGCQMVWGTDDTAAINSAVSAAATYAEAGNYFAEVLFGAKVYMVAAAPTQTTTPAVVNSQIPVPYPNVNGTTQKLVISFKGAGPAGNAQFWESTIPNLQGTCLVTTRSASSTPDSTYGVQSVIGGPTANTGLTGGCVNTLVRIDGISVWCPVYTNLKAYHFGFVAGVEWGSFSAHIFAPALAGTHPLLSDLPSQGSFQSTIGVGCIFPYNGNNDDVTGRRFAVEGYETGFSGSDHISCPSMVVVYADLCYLIDCVNTIAGGNSHLISIDNLSCEAYNGAILCNGGTATVRINLDTETLGNSDPTYDVKDQGSNLYGVVTVTDNDSRTNRRPVVTNCASLKVVNDMLGPGYWSGAPSVPNTTVAQQNIAWRDAFVVLTSGGAAVTVIAVDGHTTGLTLSTSGAVGVRVPGGKNITLTYSSTAPTWSWWLD